MHIAFGHGRATQFIHYNKVVPIDKLGIRDGTDLLQILLQELNPQERESVLNDVDLQYELFSRLMQGFRAYTGQRAHLVHGIWTPASAQLECIEKLNRRLRLGIRPEAFTQAAKHIPNWPDVDHVGLVLVPYLPDVAGRRSGPERTLRALIRALRPILENHPAHVRPFLDDCFGRGLMPRPSPPGLCWEMIDYGHIPDRGTCDQALNADSPEPAHAGVLAALLLHPGYVRAIQTHPNFQCPVAGGYRFKARKDDFAVNEDLFLSFTAPHWSEKPGVRVTYSTCREMEGAINKSALPIILKRSRSFIG